MDKLEKFLESFVITHLQTDVDSTTNRVMFFLNAVKKDEYVKDNRTNYYSIKESIGEAIDEITNSYSVY